MRPLGGALIQYDWCSSVKRKRRQGFVHIGKKKREEERGRMQVKEKALWRIQPCRQLDHGLLASRTTRKQTSVVEAFQFIVFFVIAALKMLVLKLPNWTFFQVPTPFTLSSLIKIHI